MNLSFADWLILAVMFVAILSIAWTTKKYTQSVADFLAANRCAGKYLLGVADGIAGLCAISIIALFELHYKAGFSAVWWNTMLLPVGVIIAVTGWIQYRYRQTRVLTMAQFLEVRYSRNFRVFAGILAFGSGILNFGIFPAVGGRFFQYFCGLPPWMVSIGFTEIDLTYALIMIVLLAISLMLTFLGGQIAVIVTDFIQGTFCNIAFCLIAAYLLFFHFDWDTMLEAFRNAPANASLINPANSGDTDNFNVTYFLVGLFGTFFTYMAWLGNQGYYACAKTPHASRMGRVVGSFRPIIQTVAVVLLALSAFTLLNHPDFSSDAAEVNGVLETIDNPKLQTQQTVTIALTHILPKGLLGIFAAVMFAAFVSTHDTYLHSWGSIFIQDVVLPIRQMIVGEDKPMSPKAHLRLLRYSIFGVAVFIFLFSLFFRQRQDILMFFALTGTFFLGWAGCTICGGLYWKYGTTPGAWAAAIVGLVLSLGGWYLTYFWDNCKAGFASLTPGLWQRAVDFYPGFVGDKFPFSAQVLFFWSMVATGIVYMVVSLAGGKKAFNMDRMLHRGEYAMADDPDAAKPKVGLAALRMDKKFARDDRLLYIISLLYTFVCFVGFIAVTVRFVVLDVEISDAAWGRFWWFYSLGMLIFTSVITLWFAVGGVFDLKDLFSSLATVKRDVEDDGTVVGPEILPDERVEGEARAARQEV